MAIIEARDLSKKFGKHTAVDNVSFDVLEGDVFGFLGPNGAGKTTTINMLCTLLSPSGGNASINGYNIAKQQSRVRQSIGLVFQDTTLDDYLTAEQNLLFHAYAYGIPRDVRNKRINELLELVGLADRRKSKTSTYSGGMKRRLELVRGLLHRPQVLFLDEPTLGLDPQTRRYIWDYVLSLRRRESLTVFLTTHYMDEAEYCNKIAIIDNGQIIALDTPARLKESLGGDMVTLKAEDTELATLELNKKHNLSPQVEDGLITFNVPHSDTFIPDFVQNLDSRLISINVSKPTLDDVFLKLTGHTIRDQKTDLVDQMRDMMKSQMMRPSH
ncbi:ATP-binding cassette domain-containing protein [Chloroflexota bacterium]